MTTREAHDTAWRKIWRSFAAKLIFLLAIFLAVPVVLYTQFRTADSDKKILLLKGVQEQGRLMAENILPMLERFDPRTTGALSTALARLVTDSAKAKLLFRPAGASDSLSFFYVAAAPMVPGEYLAREQAELRMAGVLDKLPVTCAGDEPLAARFTNPAGQEEVITSLTPIQTAAGCWVLITSNATRDYLGTSIGQPYWKTPEMQVTGAIYVLLVAVVVWLFLDAWRSLHRFERLARTIRTAGAANASFVEQNRIPELDGVAKEFDRLVVSLQSSAERIRQTAEENAHAFKTPIAIISQSVEPLKRAVAADNGRGRRAIEVIEESVQRLDKLVSAARRTDEVAAELVDPPRERIHLSRLLGDIVSAYHEAPRDDGVSVRASIEPDIHVEGGADLLETVVENLVDNALSFSPPHGIVQIRLRRQGRRAELSVEDDGPGIEPHLADRIFDRYFSLRPEASAEGGNGAVIDRPSHFGIGLWLVRRNVEAIGGTVVAENRKQGGLRMLVGLPLTR